MNGCFPGRGAVLRLGLLVWLGLSASVGWAQYSFSGAEVISGQWGGVTNDNTGVVPDPGGPSPAGFAPQHPLWYKWTAPESGEVTLDTLGSVDTNGVNLDTVVAVYIGPDISHLIQVGANDDYYPYWRVPNGQNYPQLVQTSETYGSPIRNPNVFQYPLPLSGPSILRFNATAGTTYYIEVDSMTGKGYSQFSTSFSWLSQVGEGLISLNWAFRPSGILRFATEEYDLYGWLYGSILNPTNVSMPPPLYQCTETESLPGGGGYPGNASVYNSYYVFDPGGVLVTVTRVAGSSGRLWVDYTTADITNSLASILGPFQAPLPAVGGTDYTPISGTLVFDDFEMSKTLVIPINPNRNYGTTTNNPNDTPTGWNTNWVDHDFQVILSNPRLDPYETTNVSPPRLDTPFATATVRIMSGAGLGSDPDENWTGNPDNTPPSHDVYNFGKRNYRVPKDINATNSYTDVYIGVFRTHQRVQATTRSETINYRVNGVVADSTSAKEWNNFFALNPGSEFAIPDPNDACPEIFPWGGTGDGAYTNHDFTMTDGADGTVTIGNLGYGTIRFKVNNDLLTKFNKDFNIILYQVVDGAAVSVGENNECHVTILCDDKDPPAGSVDEFYNTDFGSVMVPPVATVPSNQPHPGTDGTIWAVAAQPDDKTVLAGQFTTYNGTPRSCIARAMPGGAIDAGFDPGTGSDDGIISSLALLPDGSGRMMIGGTFNYYNGSYTPFIARLNSNGLLDTTFTPTNFPDGSVWALAIENTNQVVIVGDFLNVGNVPRAHIARYNADGSLDLTFDLGANAPTNGSVSCLALQPDGKVVIGGSFANLGSQPLSGLARLNADGSADTNFDANLGFGVDGVVQAVAIQGGTQIVIGGEFQNVGIAQRTRIARLNSDGTVDNTFNSGTGADDTVYNISAQPDGTMYVGGLFTTFNGTHRLGFTRLYADGTVDTSFLDTAYNQFAGLHRKYYDKQWTDPVNPDPVPDPRPFVAASQVLPDGNVVIGGGFSQVGGGQANASIRFDSDYPYTTIDTNVWTEPKARDGVRNRSNFARLVGGATPGPGNIGLLYTNFSINKSQLALNVDLIRTNGSLGFSSANFALQPGLAQSGVDYVYNSVPPLYLGSWWPDEEVEPYYSTFLNSITREHSDGLLLSNSVPTDIYGHVWFPYAPGTLLLTIENSGTPGNVDTQVQLANPSGADQFFLGGQNMPLGNALGASTAPLTIVDDSHTPGVIGFSSANYYVNENAGTATITITRTNGSAGFPSVVVSTVDGTGHAGSNYVAFSNKRITFQPGEISTNISIKIIDDGVSEPNGLTVGLRLTGVSGATLGLSSATINILDTDLTPGYLTFSSASYVTNESAGAVVLEVDRRGANKGTLSVQCITTDGTALNGTNYLGGTNTLTWNDSDPVFARYVTIPLINSGLVGPNTTFSVNLTNAVWNTNTSVPYVLANPPTATTVTIVDDNSYGKLQFSAPSYQVNENGGYITIPVIRTGGSAQSLIVTYSTANGPLASSSGPLPNYVGTTNTLTFGPGEVNKTFNVNILDDGVTDGPPANFWFSVNLSQPSQPGTLGSPSSALVYIVDAETFNYPAGSPDSSFVPNPGFNGDVYGVALQTNGGIIAVGDFSIVNNFPRNGIARLNTDSTIDTTFLNGLAGANGPIQTVLIQTDGRILAAGTFSQMNNLNRNGLVRLMSDGTLDSSFNSGAGGDNDVYAMAETFMPDRRILVGGSFLHMNGVSAPGLARLNNTGALDPAFNPNLSVNGTVYAIAVYPTNTIQGGKIVIGGSFTAVNGVPRAGVARLNSDGTLDTGFSPGAGATNAVRALAIQLDGRVLAGGSFTNFNGYALNHIARLNINGQVDTSFNVGAGTDDTVDAIVVQPDTRILLVGLFSHANGVSRNRITRLLPDGTVDPAINFGQGADNYIDTIALQPDGMMMVIGGGFSSYDGQPRPHLARVYGGSLAGSGLFQFTAASYQADETSANAVLTVRRTGGTAGNMTVDFATVGLTAVPGVNFLNVKTNLDFPTGETFQSVFVPLIHDFVITPDLLVSNYLSDPSPPSGIGDQFYALLTIFNDDSTISFSSSAYSVQQYNAAGPFPVDIYRQGSTRSNAYVTFFTTTNGTALPGLDYQAITNELVIFPPGSTNVQVPISILNNRFASNDTTVVMQLSNAANALLTEPSLATLTILTTNQAPGQFMFAQPSYTVSEAAGSLTATVLRVNGHHGRVSVDFATSNSNPLASSLYVPTNGSLAFEDSETIKSFPVQIIETHQVTGNQTFSLLLSNAVGAALIAPTNVPVTIIDDNVGLSFVNPNPILPETAGNVSLTVYRQNGTNGVTTVHYSTTNDTAVAGVNYIAASGILTFQPGVIYTNIVIGVLHDPLVTGPVKFEVNLFNPSAPAQLGTPSSATVVLLDVESGISIVSTNLIAVTNADLSVTTNASFGVLKSSGTNVPISIVVSNFNNGPLAVTYATADGTAVAGVDYVTNGGVLNLGNGIGSQIVGVQIISNRLVEGDRSFTFYLTNATPTNVASLLTPYAATITITDDTAGLTFSAPTYMTTENNKQGLVVPVFRTNYTNSYVKVDFFTADGSGLANVNYYPTNGTLYFTNGETAKSFVVVPRDNDTLDGNHTVQLCLTNAATLTNAFGIAAGSAVLVNPTTATLLVLETDGSLILPAGVALISESGPVNGVIDPGETVTLLFGLRNANGTNTVNLVASLLATNGVANPSSPQTYGALITQGPSVSRPFTFTANATNGQTITAILQLSDGSTSLSNAVFTFTVGKTPATFASGAEIVINDDAAASPYPSVITVSNLNGLLTQATVTLTNLSHGNPRDIDALLVSPAGQKVLLMSHCGGIIPINNVTLTFDSTATNALPQSTQITSGTYVPTDFDLTPPFPAPGAPFPTNATAPPYATSLSVLNGISPNGSWALYLLDDNPLFSGSVANGWMLNLDLTGPVPGSADLVLGMSASAPSVVATSNLTYTVAVTNAGPSTANNVMVTDTLPAGAVLAATNFTQGSVSAAAGLVTWNVGSLAYGAMATLNLVVQPSTSGTITNSATATSATADPNLNDNSASVTTTVVSPTADLALSMVDLPDPVLLGYNLTYTITVNNLGPASATAVMVVDTLPTGMTFVSASPNNAFTRVGQVVTFNLGTLGSNGQATATIVVQPTVPGTPLNTANCSSTVTDPFKANNRATVKTVVQQVPLTLAHVKGGLQISWPASANYILQSTTSLHPPAVWTPVTEVVPEQVGGQMVVVVPIGPGDQFFRLAYSSVPTLPLSVTRAGSNLILAWPINPWNAVVESATSLRAPVIWTAVTSPLPVVAGGQNTLTVPIGSGPQCFRLHGTTP
jgi:uncharacterized repeat protein (TIGR01451 family)/uncharacterized delta-60 repeat protein